MKPDVAGNDELDLLKDALSGLNEGCALFDADGRLIVSNAMFRDMNAPVRDILQPGMHWKTMLHEMAHRRMMVGTEGREDAWVEETLAKCRARAPFDVYRTNGSITSVQGRGTSSGGFIISEIDITARRQAEKQAKESEQLLSTLLQASPANLCMSKIGDGTIIYQSPASIDLFGQAESTRDQFADPLDRADFLAELLASNRIDDFSATARRQDGTEFPALFSARIIDYRNQEVMVSTVTDLTDLVAAERTIKDANVRLRDAIEALSEGFILYDADECVVMANQRFIEMNAPYAELITKGTHTRVLLEAAVQTGHFVDAEGWLADYEAELARGEGGSHRTFEFRMSDGTWVTSVRRPTREGGFVITWLDVTDEKLASAELARANDRMRDAIDSFDEGFALFDPKDRLVMWNRRYAEQNSYVADSIRDGVLFTDIVENALETGLMPPETVKRAQEFLANREYRRGFREEFQLNDGTWYDVAFNRTSEGGFVVSRHDITEQKRAAAELAQLNDRLRDAIDSVDQGFALFDPDDRLLIWNRRFEELNAHVADSIKSGAHFTDILSRSLDTELLEPEAIEQTRKYIEDGDYHQRSRDEFQLKNGTWYSVSHSPTSEGGFVVSRHDITRQKRAAQELARLNDRLRDAIEALDEGFALYDDQDRLVTWNQRYMELNDKIGHMIRPGVTYQDILETAIATHKLDDEEASLVRESGLRRDGNKRLRFEFESRGGRWFSISRNPTSEDGFVITRADITDAKQAAAELDRQREMLHQSEKLSALGELLAGVAHELNNPLSVVVGHALMLEEELEDPTVLQRTRKISTAAERCSRIVKTFLAMARQRPTKLELTQINALVETALEVAGYGLRSAGVTVQHDLADDLPLVNADADQLVQVLANLIVNAEHVLSPLGSDGHFAISTHLSSSGKDVVIDISDNGPGIPEHIRARIFEPFFTTKTVGEGTGIGLAFCHRVIASHNGTIEVAEARGGGAQFCIRLAAARPEDQTETDTAKPAAESGHVLVIDDEEDVADLIAHILDRDGYNVTVVHSAKAALERLPGTFDLILSDINMPDLSGKDLLNSMRERWPGLVSRLGFITGDTMSAGAEDFLSQAGRPYLEKPITPGDLRVLTAQIRTEI
ncbi:MAG: PAS-domain containing protein [Pseudomonadota bacterium]